MHAINHSTSPPFDKAIYETPLPFPFSHAENNSTQGMLEGEWATGEAIPKEEGVWRMTAQCVINKQTNALTQRVLYTPFLSSPMLPVCWNYVRVFYPILFSRDPLVAISVTFLGRSHPPSQKGGVGARLGNRLIKVATAKVEAEKVPAP